VLVGLLVVVVVPGVIYGPGLVREASTVIGPVKELASSEEALRSLDQEISFVPPEGEVIAEGRLLAFLDVREELLLRYEPWQRLVNGLQGHQTQSWAEAKQVLGLTAEVFEAQVRALRDRRMSRAEFVWLEDRIYGDWLSALDAHLPGEAGPVVTRRLRERTRADLRFVADLERRHGASAALTEMGRRLRERLAALEERRPELEGMPVESQRLLWNHRERIRSLALDRFELHGRLREGAQGVAVKAVPSPPSAER